MRKLRLVFVLLLLSEFSFSQKTKLSMFDNLIDKTWKAEGTWGDGTKFKQEIEFKYALDKKIVIAQSKGFTDKEQTKYGPRNHGIRKFDTESNAVKFWEFDIFGGLTEGTVFALGKNIFYQYQYGESVITDMWEFVNDSTYNFKVGTYKNNKWEQIYLETQFKKK